MQIITHFKCSFYTRTIFESLVNDCSQTTVQVTYLLLENTKVFQESLEIELIRFKINDQSRELERTKMISQYLTQKVTLKLLKTSTHKKVKKFGGHDLLLRYKITIYYLP